MLIIGVFVDILLPPNINETANQDRENTMESITYKTVMLSNEKLRIKTNYPINTDEVTQDLMLCYMQIELLKIKQHLQQVGNIELSKQIEKEKT